MPTPPLRPRRARSEEPSGVWRAQVTRVGGGGVYVTVARLAGTRYEWGPCPIVAGPWAPLTTAVGAGPDAHVHELGPALVAGDRVLVAFVEGKPNDVVVIGRIA